MKFLFGKSQAAMLLEKAVESNPTLQAKVMSHISDYNHYVDVVSRISDKSVRVKALSACMECKLEAPEYVITLIRNLKVAKRREAIIR